LNVSLLKSEQWLDLLLQEPDEELAGEKEL